MFVKGNQRDLEAARKGGAAVPADRRAFSQDRDLAKRAGQKGGGMASAETRSFSTNRELAREAGRKGGSAKRRPREVTP